MHEKMKMEKDNKIQMKEGFFSLLDLDSSVSISEISMLLQILTSCH